MPLAETQMATVLSNADPQGKGRVRVRMNWQTDGMQTGWVRVMTPDGGSSSDVKGNRGFVFIPEVGDQVLLGFRHGDPARPYILGSLFNGVTGSGGFAANHKKSLTTRSGSTVTFDDTAHTILLQTTRANKIFIDELNGIITISSAEEVNVNTKNVNIKRIREHECKCWQELYNAGGRTVICQHRKRFFAFYKWKFCIEYNGRCQIVY